LKSKTSHWLEMPKPAIINRGRLGPPRGLFLLCSMLDLFYFFSFLLVLGYWGFCGFSLNGRELALRITLVANPNKFTSRHLFRWCVVPVYMFDKVFASFSLLTCKNLHTQKCTSIDTLEIEMTCIT
jgi:hypothetical protein